MWIAVSLAALALAAVFVVPTVWGRPWSIDHFFRRVALEYLLRRPMLLSRVRLLEQYGLHFHADQLDDFSLAFRERSLRWMERTLHVLRLYDPARLAPEQRTSASVLEWLLQTAVDGKRFWLHDVPFNATDGIQSALPDFLLNVHPLANGRDARHYVARLARMGDALDQAMAGARERARRGLLPPRFVLERVHAEVVAFTRPRPAQHVLVRHFQQRIEALDTLAQAEREERLSEVRVEMERSVYPSYRRLTEFLADLLRRKSPRPEAAGVWRLPDGIAYYAWALRWHTTTDLAAEEIHELGCEEMARLEREIRELLAALGVREGPLGESTQCLAQEQRFRYPPDESGRTQILEDYRAIVESLRTRLPEWFGRLPRAPLRVERIPEFRETGAPGAYYRPPPLDGAGPGVFYVNLRDVGETVRFGMRTLACHEALPGHHLQFALAQENRALPLFRRLLPFTAFTEGWALYAEGLAHEEGLLPTPEDRLGYLLSEALRAARLVVDTGLHARRWSRQEAVAYLVDHAGLARAEAVTEVERYAVMPGQACAYKIGQLRILALRARAHAALGERFDLRAFHDAVLAHGALPLTVLDTVIDAWIAEQAEAAVAERSSATGRQR